MATLMTTIRPLSPDQYAKTTFRARQASLPYPEKVRQLVAMQRRLVPIYAARGKIIVPWTLDATSPSSVPLCLCASVLKSPAPTPTGGAQ